MIFNAQYFIDLFESIPEDKWTTGRYQDIYGRRCAMGHCWSLLKNSNESRVALAKLFKTKNLFVTHVNDGITFADSSETSFIPGHLELGATPKQRILAVLKMCKEQGL